MIVERFPGHRHAAHAGGHLLSAVKCAVADQHLLDAVAAQVSGRQLAGLAGAQDERPVPLCSLPKT